MMTSSGRRVTMTEGAPSLDDIVLGLSRMPRFAGQSREPWSVLQHSVLCEELAIRAGGNERLRLLCLLHDAHEAVTGDIPTTLKTVEQRRLQQQLDVRIFAELGVPFPDAVESAFVAMIDARALCVEGKVLGPKDWPWPLYGMPTPNEEQALRQVKEMEDPRRWFRDLFRLYNPSYLAATT